MNETETAILQTLIELDDAVKGIGPDKPKPNLLPVFTRLDDLAGRLPSDADPELKHFLQRKSYAKARERLEGRFPAAGACGGGGRN